MNEFVKTHSVVSVLMFPISGGRKPAMDAFSRALCVTIEFHLKLFQKSTVLSDRKCYQNNHGFQKTK